MTNGLDLAGADPGVRRARLATLAALGTVVLTSLVFPGIGLLSEPAPEWIVLGAIGILGFVASEVGALYAAITPWLLETRRHRLTAVFLAMSVVSVVLVGPVGDDDWETWAWLGACVAGSAPLLVGLRAAPLVIAVAVAASAGIGWSTGGAAESYALLTLGIGLMLAVMCALPVWLLGLLVRAQVGRVAQGRLAAAEERLRFARDVHDLLGHNLSVIAVKAELGARLTRVDPERATREAAEVQRLATSALADVREAVHGYRVVDLDEQLRAIEQVLASSGVRCTITGASSALPPEIASELAAVVREASTNVLRHSRAGWCEISLARDIDEVRLKVSNDGVVDQPADRRSYGLRGLAERLGDRGGVLQARAEDGVFTLEAIIPAGT